MNLRWIASLTVLGTACSTAPDFGDGTASSTGSASTSGASTTSGLSTSGGGEGGWGEGGDGGRDGQGGDGGDGLAASQSASTGGGQGGQGGGAGGGGGDLCGNGVLDDGETCDDASAQCVGCAFTCPDGWVAAESYTACYGLLDASQLGSSFFLTASTCAALAVGGQRARLPTPRTFEDVAALASLERPDHVWLGATDLQVEGVRTWIDEPDVPFALDDAMSGWAVGEPNDLGGEDCVLLRRDVGDLLVEGRCGDPHPGAMVCELVPGWALEERCGDDSLDRGEECDRPTELRGRTCDACNFVHVGLGAFYESPIDHVFFGAFSANPSKADAGVTCGSLGARLATPDDPGDISVLRDVSGGNAGWLGATPLIGVGMYTWDSEEPFDFLAGAYPWAMGEPSSVNLPLVMLGGELLDVDPSSFATPCEIGDVL